MSDIDDGEKIIFHVIFRKPNYPVIVISSDRLRVARSLKTLAEACLMSPIVDSTKHVIVLDATGEEFWYLPDQYTVAPGFFPKRWTKKRMIDLYNQSANAQETGVTYSDRSLGSKSFDRIVSDLCALIQKKRK